MFDWPQILSALDDAHLPRSTPRLDSRSFRCRFARIVLRAACVFAVGAARCGRSTWRQGALYARGAYLCVLLAVSVPS
jgi:hypothetical protein